MKPWLQKSAECYWTFLEMKDFMKMLNITTLDEARALWFAIASKIVWVNDARLITGGSLLASAMYISSPLENVRADDILCQEGTCEARERIAQLFMDHLVYTDDINNWYKYPDLVSVTFWGNVRNIIKQKVKKYKKRKVGKPWDLNFRTIKVPYWGEE